MVWGKKKKKNRVWRKFSFLLFMWGHTWIKFLIPIFIKKNTYMRVLIELKCRSIF